MTTGIIKGTGYRARTGADQFRGVVAPSILPAWMFIGGSLPPLYQWNVLGTLGNSSTDTSVASAYQRGVFATPTWALPSGLLAGDVDVGTCTTPGGRTDSRFGSWATKTIAYSGGAMRNANSFYILQGSGHTTGFNNGVIGLGLENAVPLWENVSPCTPSSLIQGTPVAAPCSGSGGATYDPNTMPRFLDNRNVGGHAGYANQFFQGEDKLVISRALGIQGSGGSGAVLRTFDWASKGATNSATGWNGPPYTQYPVAFSNGSAGYGGIMCSASRGGVGHIYFTANNRMNVWIYPNATAAPISSIAFSGTAPDGYVGLCYDSDLDRLFLMDARTWRWQTWDCTTGANVTGLVASPPAFQDAANGTPNTCIEYDAVGKRYLLNASSTGGTDYATWWSIDPTTKAVAQLQITNAPSAGALGLKTFNRARIAPNLGIIVCANAAQSASNAILDTQVYWMRIR